MKNFKSKLNFLVIGSNSFSGSHFIDYVLKKKHLTIGVSRSNEINSVFLPYKNNINKKLFKFYKSNLNNKGGIKFIIKLIKKQIPPIRDFNFL
jgi:dTDP-glucose 4,6-dehydratase